MRTWAAMEYERRVTIAPPPDRVFAFVSDPGQFSRWRDGLQASRVLDDTAGTDVVRSIETLQTPLGVRDVTVEVRRDPPHGYAFEVVDGPIRPNGALTLRATATGTEVTYRITYEPRVRTPLDGKIFDALRTNVDRSTDNLVALAGDM
ncbi:MAG: hypothetical protein NVS1B2_11690 [Vulcanimicrobiaceae bacterium]